MLLALAGGSARADGPPGAPLAPRTPVAQPEPAADAVLAASKAKDEAALKALAAKDEPDPWLVADELVRRGELDAAVAFATAAPRLDVEKLPAYLGSRRGPPDDTAAREVLATMNRALQANDFPAALAADGPAGGVPPADVVGVRRAFGYAIALQGLNRLEASETAFLAAADAAERMGWYARASAALGMGGMCAARRMEYRRALAAWERHLELCRSRGDRKGEAGALVNVGIVHGSLGSYAKALECHERAAKLHEELGDRTSAAQNSVNVGNVHASLGNHSKALEHFERALKLKEGVGDRPGVAAVLGNIGSVHKSLGKYAKALEHLERSLRMFEDLGDRVGAAGAHVNIGNVHMPLADLPRALEHYERGLKEAEAVGQRHWAAYALGGLGAVHAKLGAYEKALEYLSRAAELSEAIGDRSGVATMLVSLGALQGTQGDHAKALTYLERGLKLKEDLGDRAGAVAALVNIGAAYASLRDYPKALQFLDRATREAQRLRADNLLAKSLQFTARVRLEMAEFPRALDAARRATTLLETLLTGLAEEQGATAREQFTTAFEVGAVAAARLEDPGEVTYFLESGRAGSLLEALGGKQAMSWRGVPEGLRTAQAQALGDEAAALKAYERSLDGGDRPAIGEASKALDTARARVREVVDRIQREARREADIWYPRAATTEEIQRWLADGDALVLYGLCGGQALALVLTREEARVVALGPAAEVTVACEALHADDREEDPAPALARLRHLLIDPLRLVETTKRLLVSAEGPLSYLPFAAVAPELTVLHESSGTTYGLLLEEARKRGQGVLALGDPTYDGEGSKARSVVWRGRPLARLPATRDEVLAVGDVRLLGADASEAGLRAALPRAQGGRWRAVHFACHGLVDAERPTLSSLALSKDGENDGFLTALEVLDLDVPADLVVLSACETGTGKIVRGEGIVGLTRAFMFAGAPRVICSLWKVDDEATSALMAKFYELWNPKDGKPGLPTAEALRKAQAFIRSQEKWKHPFYWAAWVLWGLPE